jgi:hypothetical protein
MNRLRLVVAAVLTAAILVTAAVAAPSASAQQFNHCGKIFQKLQMYHNVLKLLEATGYGATYTAWEVSGEIKAYDDAHRLCMGG